MLPRKFSLRASRLPRLLSLSVEAPIGTKSLGLQMAFLLGLAGKV